MVFISKMYEELFEIYEMRYITYYQSDHYIMIKKELFNILLIT